MKKNLILTISGLVLGGALSAGALAGCGSAGSAATGSGGQVSHPPSATAPPPSTQPPTTQPPGTPPPTTPPPSSTAGRLTVTLGPAFNPGTLRVKVGEQFLVTVSPAVSASGLSCTQPEAGASLAVQCVGQSQYLYRAVRPGSAELSAEVRPNCKPGSVCPQWITMPRLQITIVPAPHPNQ